jgi:hypothetical protein
MMGVDIYGRAPRSEAGRYFAANWTAWRDLAGVCFRVAPGPCSQIDEKFWFSNDGRGLDDAGAIALADALDRAIETDRLLKHEDELSGHETADDLHVRNYLLDDGRTLGDALQIPEGPWLINSLRDLTAFLRNSGGFAIW